MKNKRFTTPAWMAITAAALTLPMIVLGIILDVLARRNPDFAATLLMPYLLVVVVQTFCALFALARFKTLLNERHGFHEVDGLIVAIIIGVCALTLVALSGRISLVLLGVDQKVALAFVSVLFTLGLALSVLSIIFAVKLLRLPTDLESLMKPFAWVTIAAAVCFVTFILAPVGLLLDAVSNVLLAMIFLRGTAPPSQPDFV